MRRWFAYFALGGFLLGCSSAGSSNFGGNAGYGGNIGAQGCTATPDCGACDGCYSQCVCSTGAKDQCVSACGLNPTGAGGTGGAGGSGAGGSGGSGAGGSGAGGSGVGGAGGTGGATPVGNLAGGLRITEISINQAVKIPIMQNGSPVSNRNAPVVQGRAALMRVFVTPDPGYQARDVVARLTVNGQADQTITKNVTGASSDGDFQSAFNFDIPAEQMTGSTQFDVQVEEASGASSNGATDGARWPQSGSSDMGAVNAGPFKVVLVPLVMNGITADASNAHIQTLHDALMGMYPTTDVQVTVSAPKNCTAVSYNGSGWSNALDTVSNFRNSLGVDSRTYIYGMAAPSNSMQSYCGQGCVAGLGSVPQANDPYGRAAIGLGYFPDGSGGPSQYSTGSAATTVVHELGHALGRNHSPCAPQGSQLTGVDGAYPYQGASIGVWGWDLIGKQTKSPSQFTDVMGYCSPTWISDYTYRNIETRIAYVNAHGYVIPSPDPARAPGTFRVAIIEPDGSMHFSGTRYFMYPQYGEEREVQTLDANGNPTGSVVGFFNAVSDLPGGMLYVRESALSASIHAIQALSLSKSVLTLH